MRAQECVNDAQTGAPYIAGIDAVVWTVSCNNSSYCGNQLGAPQ